MKREEKSESENHCHHNDEHQNKGHHNDGHHHNGCDNNDHQNDDHHHDGRQLDKELQLHGLDIEPAIVSFTKRLNIENGISGAQLCDAYWKKMSDLCLWAEEHSFLIGHIKLYAEVSDSTLWMSTTGDGISLEKDANWDLQRITVLELSFTAIVFGVSRAGLLKMCELESALW